MIDNFDQIPLSDFPYYPDAYEGMSMENSVDDPYNPGFQVRECECQEYNEYQGLCKICGGSGIIYTSKKTGLEYGQPYEQQRFLVPVKAHMLSGKERKYGQNWAKSLHMCPRCCEAVPIGFRIRSGRLEAYCRKCDKLRHVKGSHLFWVKEPDFKKVIDG